MHKLTARLTVLILGPSVLACLALSAGCASPATGKAMTASELRLPKHNASTVFVHVAGGQETEVVINMPRISSDAFREALVATIEGSHLFARVLPQAPADYRLEIGIVEAKQKGALTTDTTMTARWKLIRSSDGKGVFNEFIESSGESSFTIGPARLRHSLESAGRENIKLGLTKLSQLDLQREAAK